MNTNIFACIDGGLICIPTLLICAGAAFLGKKFLKICKRSCKCACHPDNKLQESTPPFGQGKEEDYEWFHVGQTVNVRGESFTKGIINRIVVGQYIRIEQYWNGDEDSRPKTADVYPSQLSPNTDSIMYA